MFGFVIISNLFFITIKSDRNMQFFLSFCSVLPIRSSPNVIAVAAAAASHDSCAQAFRIQLFSVKTVLLRFYVMLLCFFFRFYLALFLCFDFLIFFRAVKIGNARMKKREEKKE